MDLDTKPSGSLPVPPITREVASLRDVTAERDEEKPDNRQPAPVAYIGVVEEFFQRLALWGPEEDWEPIQEYDPPFVGLKRLKTEDQICRITCDVDLPFADAVQMMRPEVMWLTRRPEFDNLVEKVEVEQIYAPGDVALRAVCSGNSATLVGGMIASLVSKLGSLRAGLWGTAEADNSIIVRLRMVTRRDYPKKGQHCAVVITRDPETGALVDEWSIYKTNLFVLQPLEDPARTRVIAVRPWSPLPSWAERLARPKMCSMATTFMKFRLEQVAKLYFHPDCKEIIAGADNYVVVSLRRCTRGTPLLPVKKAEQDGQWSWDWEARKDLQGPKTPLPEYLREFVARLGLPAILVFGSLDGWLLMPYQAAVRRGEWEKVWTEMDGPWREQRAAYRKLFGGSYAPELTVGGDPKFQMQGGKNADTMDSARAPSDGDGPEAGAEAFAVEDGLEFVSGTFIHIKDIKDGPSVRPRANSEQVEERPRVCSEQAES